MNTYTFAYDIPHSIGIRTLLSVIFFALSLITSDLYADERLLDKASLPQWEEKVFSEKTQYSEDNSNAESANKPFTLKAHSQNSASGLFLEKEINLDKTPFISWSWKIERSSLIENPIHQERTKAGDDYTLRLYVVIKDSFYFWRTRALTYVWSANQSTGTHWLSPFTENAVMTAVDSGKTHLGQWRTHKRNLKQDIEKYLGLDASKVHAVALMSDSDNTHGENTVYFGSISVSAK